MTFIPSQLVSFSTQLGWKRRVVYYGVVVLILGLSLNFFNPVTVGFLAVSLLLLPFAFYSLNSGLIVFLLVVSVADFFKRLTFVGSPEVSDVAYYLIVFVPDVLFLGVFFYYLWQLKFNISLQGKLNSWIWLFCLWNILALFNPLTPWVARLAGFKLFSLYLLAFFLGKAYSQEITADRLKKLSFVLLSIGIIASLYGLYQYFFGYSSFELAWLGSDKPSIGLRMLTFHNVNRAFSLFSGVNSLSLYLGLCLLWLRLGYFLWKEKGFFLLVPFFLTALLAGLAVTLSRGVWVGLVISLLSVAVSRGLGLSLKTMLVVVMVLMILIFAFQKTTLYEITFRGLEKGSPFVSRALEIRTFYGRVNNLWVRLGKQMAATPARIIYGFGLGSKSAATKMTGKQPEVLHYGADNMYLEMVYQLGIIGLIIFLVIIWKFFSLLPRIWRKSLDEWTRAWVWVGISFIILLLADGVIASALDLRPVNFFFWFFLGSLTALAQEERENFGPK